MAKIEKMVNRIITAIALFSLLIINAQDRNPFYIGHSLVNHDMPIMVQALATDAGKTAYYDKQIIIGSPLQYNYNNPNSAQGIPYTTAFPDGNFNTLIITEAIPLQNHLSYSDTFLYANNFYSYAKNNNNDVPIRFYIYETWHCKNSGIPQSGLPTGCEYDTTTNSNMLWHPRLQADFPLWTGIVNEVRNQNSNEDEIWLVPAGQAFYNLTNQINDGNLSGITNFTDLFSDDIHLNNLGNYFVACVMYATLYRQSPVGLTTNINNQWDTPFTDMPTPAQALVMQQVAWSTVTSLSTWTGVSTTLSNQEFDMQKQELSVYPNPSSDYITIDLKNFNETDEIKIYNSMGLLVKEVPIKEAITIHISDLPSGLYFIHPKSTRSIYKFIIEK